MNKSVVRIEIVLYLVNIQITSTMLIADNKYQYQNTVET